MIIGLSGKAQSGKGEYAAIARSSYGATIISFAAGVKEEVAEFLTAFDVCWEQRHLYGTANDKEAYLRISDYVLRAGLVPEVIKEFFAQHAKPFGRSFLFTPRAFMQWWGTEFRRGQNPNYWVERAMARCSGAGLYVIDDVRFKNEAQMIRDLGGYLVRIERPNRPQSATAGHASETDLDDWVPWDAVVSNNDTLAEYRLEVKDSLDTLLSAQLSLEALLGRSTGQVC